VKVADVPQLAGPDGQTAPPALGLARGDHRCPHSARRRLGARVVVPAHCSSPSTSGSSCWASAAARARASCSASRLHLSNCCRSSLRLGAAPGHRWLWCTVCSQVGHLVMNGLAIVSLLPERTHYVGLLPEWLPPPSGIPGPKRLAPCCSVHADDLWPARLLRAGCAVEPHSAVCTRAVMASRPATGLVLSGVYLVGCRGGGRRGEAPLVVAVRPCAPPAGRWRSGRH
jgi:hypothetical protein